MVARNMNVRINPTLDPRNYLKRRTYYALFVYWLKIEPLVDIINTCSFHLTVAVGRVNKDK